MSLRVAYFAFLFILIFGIFCYSNSFDCGFHFDDSIAIVQNAAARDITDINAIWKAFNTRFLVGLSFAANYSVGGLHPFGYHAVNLLIHVFNAFGVYLLVFLIFRTPALKTFSLRPYGDVFALFSALIFLTHPLQTEAVTYISQRFTLMYVFFYLSCLNLYLYARLTDKALYRMVALLTAILGMFCKESILPLPLMVLACEFYFFGEDSTKLGARIKYIFPFFLSTLIIPLIILSDDFSLLSLGPRREISLMRLHWPNVLTEINTVATYLRLLIFPVRQNFDYDIPASAGFFSLATFFSFLLIVLLLLSAVLQFKRRRIISFCILWFFITISMEVAVCVLFAPDVLFEHYLYLAMAGFGLFLTTASFMFLKDIKKVVAFLSVLVVVFSFLAFQRNKVWKTPVTLWEDTLSKSPNKPRVYYNLAIAYSSAGEYKKAVELYYRAIMVVMNLQSSELWALSGRAFWEHLYETEAMVESFVRRGLISLVYGNYDNRMNPYRASFLSRRNLADWYAHLGETYGKMKNFDKQITLSQKALTLDSNNALAYCNLGRAFKAMGDYPKAQEFLRKSDNIDRGICTNN